MRWRGWSSVKRLRLVVFGGAASRWSVRSSGGSSSSPGRRAVEFENAKDVVGRNRAWDIVVRATGRPGLRHIERALRAGGQTYPLLHRGDSRRTAARRTSATSTSRRDLAAAGVPQGRRSSRSAPTRTRGICSAARAQAVATRDADDRHRAAARRSAHHAAQHAPRRRRRWRSFRVDPDAVDASVDGRRLLLPSRARVLRRSDRRRWRCSRCRRISPSTRAAGRARRRRRRQRAGGRAAGADQGPQVPRAPARRSTTPSCSARCPRSCQRRAQARARGSQGRLPRRSTATCARESEERLRRDHRAIRRPPAVDRRLPSTVERRADERLRRPPLVHLQGRDDRSSRRISATTSRR